MTGTPSVMTANKIEELKRAFSMGFNDKEAILFCNIAERTFYDYCSKNKDFAELKELLKNKPKMNAKQVVIKKIEEGDDFNARWYLERVSRDEFSLKSEVDNNINGKLEVNSTKDLTTEELLRLASE